MLNEFGSYADTLDNTKNDLNRKNLSTERNNYCTGNVSDIGSRSANLPVPAATWNCNPYLGNFYNYYGNNSYDTSDVHQYDNQKCVNQFSRNYPQHTIQSASVLQCCDPRCQLFSDHSKYPFSNTLANKYNNQRPKTKNCYDVEPSKCDKGIERAKYPAFAYPPMQSNMSKYNGQQSNYNALYQNSVKSKHMILPPPPPPPPTETSSLGDYYTDIGKPSYWNKQTFWNRGIPNSYYQQPPPPPAPTFDHDKMQKIGHEQNNVNQRGILFNRLLDHRKVYDPSYLPNYHYARPPLTLPNKNTSYYQSYPEREFANCDGPRAQNSYQTLPFNVHYVDPTNTHKEKDAKAEEKRLLDKNPNLDVREFLSTWDDVEDDKVAEPEPVIVLDCSSLETEALAKVKEKLDVSFEPSNTVLKVIHDEISPHTSVIQESAERHEKERHDKDAEGYWYGQKKKDDLSYDLVEMTERLVNTVDKLFGDEKSEKEIYEAKEAEKNEDEWNINFNYKRKPPPPEPRYKPKEDLVPYKSYQDEAEKNVSCSFNLQKTTNDLKFSVNYSKQTESYAAKVQDYSVKCKTTEKEKCKRVEDYAYKNYYNSFYYNNPNCEYMQMENVKECAYDVENIDKEICNDASDITLVKADLEKSLKEITHRFSYQKKIESTEKELPKEKSSYDYQQNYLERDLELPKLDEVHDKHESATSVIQKTSSCVENNVYDERDELCNENSMLSMPSLSPPPANQENRISSVGLTLNDVYDDEVIFDALHKPQEDKEGLNFLNIVKNDDKRESVVYPLNLAITKEKDLGSSNLQEAKDDNVSKVDDGYYSVENHFDRDNKNEYDNQDGDEARMDEGKKPIYKTCIVAREQYEPCFQDASRDCDNLIERNNQTRVPSPILNLVKEPVIVETDPRDVDGFADSNKLHSSSTDDEKLLKSSKFKKYKKHKKMKNQHSSVIKENGHFNFHKMFPNIQACVEEAQKNEETIKESHPSGKSPTKNGHNGSLPILVAENETDDLEGECNLKKRKFCFVKDADLPVKKRKQGMAGMESFTDVDRSHETKMESAPCMVTGVLEGSEYSLNGKYQVDTKEDLSEHKISTADDVCRQKSKKKHKKDKDRVKIKNKKQKKKEKIHEQRKAHNDDTKSPERAMLDGLNDACKFPTSVAELRGTRMHAIYQNGDDFGAETVNDDHLDNEPIAGSLGEEMRSRVETAMETEINPICVNSNDELAYSSKRDLDGHETRSRETTEKHALSDGENYTSRRKKFKYNALSDDERWQSFRSTFKLSSDKPHSVVIESQYEGVLDQPSEHESNDVTIYETDIQTEDEPCPCQIPESIPPDSNVSPLNESAYSVPSPESPGTPPEPLEMSSESIKTPPESTEMPPESPTTPEPSKTPPESPDILPQSPETPLEPSETPPESPGILPQSPGTPLEPSETPPESPGVLPQSPGTPLEPSETPPESPRMPQSPGTPLEPSETPPESPEISPELPRTPPEPSETSTELPEIPPEPPRSPPVHPETPPELSVTLPQSPKPHLQSPKTAPEPSEASPRDFIDPPIIPDPLPSFESTADELLRSPEPNDLSSAGVNHEPDVSDLQRVPQPDSPVGDDLQKDVPNLSHVDTNVLEDAEVEPVNVVENDLNEVILTSSSKDPSPRRTSTNHLEAESGDKWSRENSPRVDNFINREWPVDAVPEVETCEQEWRENSSFLDDNIDHEEAISDVPGQDRCIWSNENSPDVSDEEDCVAFAEYKDTSNWSRDISPCPSETTPKKSTSSDSDSEDEDCSKTPRSKASLSDDESDKRSPKKSYDSSDAESNHACDKDSDESSNCDETPKIDDFFNIPSVAPTPHCDLNKEEDDCKFDESSKLDIHSKAPSPNCNFHEEAPSPFCILNEVTDEPKPSYYDHSNVSSVAPSPKCDIIDGAIDDVKGQEDIPSQEIPPEVPSLRELAAGALAKLTFSSVPSFSNLLEVWVTPERTEIIIHSEDNEPSKTDLVINDNQVMITDAYDDDDVNMATNFDQIKEIAFDYSMGLDAVSDDKPDDDVQCQCLIISSEESVVCLRCSLNSSIIVNQDLDGANFDDKVDHIVYENEITPDSCDISYIPTNCIEDSFIDQKLNVTPDHVEEVITESIPIPNQTQEDQEADNEVENITVSAPLAEHHSRNVQLKVQLPWHKIFNLNQDKSQDHKVLELGPAKIQLRLSSDDNGNLPKSIEERASPVVKVKRLVLQRAVDVVEQRTPSPVNQSDTKEVVSRLPKMVIKKTSCKEYKSFLQHNTLQPVVKLYKYKGLDELARKMTQVNNYSVNLKELKLFSIPDHVIDSTPRVVSVHQDTDLGHPASQEDSGDEPDTILEPISDTSTKRDLASIPESHHCLLCHRSFPSEESYRIHIKSRYHRHLELTQRKTIHAMYRHFTGHICPRLRPLSVKERKKMKWKPRSANVNHFYHEKTPLQIALHKSVFENKPKAKCS